MQDRRKRLLFAFPDADCEPATLEGCLEVEGSKHLHTIACDGEFLTHDAYVSKSKSLDQGVHDLDVRDRDMGC